MPTPYLNYFTLPAGGQGGERYYTFTQGPVQFFAIDSDPAEPDGTSSTSVQAQWLHSQLTALSRDHLVNIVKAYRLPIDVALSDADLVDAIVSAAKRVVG